MDTSNEAREMRCSPTLEHFYPSTVSTIKQHNKRTGVKAIIIIIASFLIVKLGFFFSIGGVVWVNFLVAFMLSALGGLAVLALVDRIQKISAWSNSNYNELALQKQVESFDTENTIYFDITNNYWVSAPYPDPTLLRDLNGLFVYTYGNEISSKKASFSTQFKVIPVFQMKEKERLHAHLMLKNYSGETRIPLRSSQNLTHWDPSYHAFGYYWESAKDLKALVNAEEVTLTIIFGKDTIYQKSFTYNLPEEALESYRQFIRKAKPKYVKTREEAIQSELDAFDQKLFGITKDPEPIVEKKPSKPIVEKKPPQTLKEILKEELEGLELPQKKKPFQNPLHKYMQPAWVNKDTKDVPYALSAGLEALTHTPALFEEEQVEEEQIVEV